MVADSRRQLANLKVRAIGQEPLGEGNRIPATVFSSRPGAKDYGALLGDLVTILLAKYDDMGASYLQRAYR